MINPDKIKTINAALAAALNVELVRSETEGERPRCIFLSYKVMSQEDEPDLGRIDRYTEIEGEDTKLLHSWDRNASISVSYTIIGPSSDYFDTWNVAIAATDWFESDEGDAAMSAHKISGSIKGPVQDRSAYLETAYETRLGFDVIFTHTKTKEEEVDAVDIEKTLESIEEVA